MYIAIFLVGILICISAYMVIWSLKSSDGVYQFPLFAGGAWLFYIVPQVIGVINNPKAIPSGIIRDHGIELAILMACLCALASFIGYRKQSKRALLRKRVDILSINKVFMSGLFLGGIANFAYFQLISLSGGFNSYINGGNYQLVWRGLPVMYAFLMALNWPALMLCLMATLKKPTLLRWIFILLLSVQPIISITMLGRRSSFVTFFLIIGISLFFIRRWTPPKYIVIAAMISALTFVLVAPNFRGEKSFEGKIEKLKETSISNEYSSLLEGEGFLEFMVPVAIIPTLNNSLQFGFGRGFYNAVVQNWVPTKLVGKDFKKSLHIPTVDVQYLMQTRYGWSIPYGSNPTGIGDAFMEFWFFGILLYYYLGRFFRAVWDRAVLCGSFFSMIFYVALIPVGMETVFGSFTQLPSRIFYLLIFLYPLLIFCKKAKREQSLWVINNSLVNSSSTANRG